MKRALRLCLLPPPYASKRAGAPRKCDWLSLISLLSTEMGLGMLKMRASSGFAVQYGSSLMRVGWKAATAVRNLENFEASMRSPLASSSLTHAGGASASLISMMA